MKAKTKASLRVSQLTAFAFVAMGNPRGHWQDVKLHLDGFNQLPYLTGESE